MLRCYLYGKEPEINSHLFLHSGVTDQLWQLFLNVKGNNWTMPNSTGDLLVRCNSSGSLFMQKNRWKTIPACI